MPPTAKGRRLSVGIRHLAALNVCMFFPITFWEVQRLHLPPQVYPTRNRLLDLHLSSQAPYCVALPAARQWCPEAHGNAACYMIQLCNPSTKRNGKTDLGWFLSASPTSCANISKDGGSIPFWLISTKDFLFSCRVRSAYYWRFLTIRSGNATIGKLPLRTCLPLRIVTSRIITTTRCPGILCADSLLQLLLTSRVTNEKRRLEMGPNIWGKGCNGLPNS